MPGTHCGPARTGSAPLPLVPQMATRSPSALVRTSVQKTYQHSIIPHPDCPLVPSEPDKWPIRILESPSSPTRVQTTNFISSEPHLGLVPL